MSRPSVKHLTWTIDDIGSGGALCAAPIRLKDTRSLRGELPTCQGCLIYLQNTRDYNRKAFPYVGEVYTLLVAEHEL